jgi:hypothetical protein
MVLGMRKKYLQDCSLVEETIKSKKSNKLLIHDLEI